MDNRRKKYKQKWGLNYVVPKIGIKSNNFSLKFIKHHHISNINTI